MPSNVPKLYKIIVLDIIILVYNVGFYKMLVGIIYDICSCLHVCTDGHSLSHINVTHEKDAIFI